MADTLTNNIIEFLKDLSGIEEISPDSDIFGDIGMTGDDFHEMIEKYSKRFSVDMTGYLWYFHTDEEGQNFGGQFFDPPYKRVKRIPITPNLLTEFAKKGKWDINYPNHIIPDRRYDIVINRITFGLFLLTVIILVILKLL